MVEVWRRRHWRHCNWERAALARCPLHRHADQERGGSQGAGGPGIGAMPPVVAVGTPWSCWGWELARLVACLPVAFLAAASGSGLARPLARCCLYCVCRPRERSRLRWGLRDCGATRGVLEQWISCLRARIRKLGLVNKGGCKLAGTARPKTGGPQRADQTGISPPAGKAGISQQRSAALQGHTCF